MLVGQAFSGKSKVLEGLQKSISSLKGIANFVNVAVSKLNPKSITSDQLYGKLDPETKTWSDGVIAIIMRECAQDSELSERKWIVFDGPVDAVWIENMNTVLDDNKKLCLTSGEIIKMTNWMTMMFEVEDLSQASPATVSRCGMVFLESHQIGWMSLIKSFVNQIPPLVAHLKDFMQTKLQWIVDCTLAWCKKYAKFPVYGSEMILVKNLLSIMQTYLNEFKIENAKLPKDCEDMLSHCVLFSAIWSVGAALEESCRKPFNEFLLRLITADSGVPETFKLDLTLKFEPQAVQAKFPEKVNVFDMIYEKSKNAWVSWT